MANQISITCDAKVQLHASKVFFSVWNEMQRNHAVVSGFALSFFGSSRHTDDFDILVDLALKKIWGFFTPTNYAYQSAFRGVEAQISLCSQACGRSRYLGACVDKLGERSDRDFNNKHTWITVGNRPYHDYSPWREGRKLRHQMFLISPKSTK